MDSRQIALVRESFEAIRPIPKAFGLEFYDRLFRLDPSLKSLFKGSMENQAAMFASALAMSVAGLGEAGYVPASVRELGARHEDYGTKDAHFDTFRDALLGTLESTLGPQFTPEVRAAWSAAFGALAGAMKIAAADARAEKARQQSQG
jgi:hemoglobin-like flavoprotein